MRLAGQSWCSIFDGKTSKAIFGGRRRYILYSGNSLKQVKRSDNGDSGLLIGCCWWDDGLDVGKTKAPSTRK